MTERTDPNQHENSPNTHTFNQVINEERNILRNQYEMMQHIDDRALRITRTSAVLLGITFTGLSLLLEPSSDGPYLIAPKISTVAVYVGCIGLISLTFSLIIGIVTTQYSQPIYGIGERIRHGLSERRNAWKATSELSDEYDDAISVMQTRLERNRNLLWSVQILFILGLVCLLIGSGIVISDAV